MTLLVCSEVDLQPPPKRQFCGGSQQAIEKMIAFGRELRQMCDQLRLEHGASEANEKALRVSARLVTPAVRQSPLALLSSIVTRSIARDNNYV